MYYYIIAYNGMVVKRNIRMNQAILTNSHMITHKNPWLDMSAANPYHGGFTNQTERWFKRLEMLHYFHICAERVGHEKQRLPLTDMSPVY